jgi:hypothetical protein
MFSTAFSYPNGVITNNTATGIKCSVAGFQTLESFLPGFGNPYGGSGISAAGP